jgi:hypothetical protein
MMAISFRAHRTIWPTTPETRAHALSSEGGGARSAPWRGLADTHGRLIPGALDLSCA